MSKKPTCKEMLNQYNMSTILECTKLSSTCTKCKIPYLSQFLYGFPEDFIMTCEKEKESVITSRTNILGNSIIINIDAENMSVWGGFDNPFK